MLIDAHRGGGERGRGALHVPPIKIFEKLPHKNAIKNAPPWFSHNPKYHPQKNLPKKTKDPPLWISNYCASMEMLKLQNVKALASWQSLPKKLVHKLPGSKIKGLLKLLLVIDSFNVSKRPPLKGIQYIWLWQIVKHKNICFFYWCSIISYKN